MRRNSIPALLPDLPGLLFFIVFPALVFFDGGKVLIDGDTFWHVKAGLYMVEKGALLSRDIFSHTAFGTAWTAHEWLSEVVMALVHRFAGLQGVAVFFLFIAALSFWILFKIALRFANDRVALACVLLAFGFSLSHMLARPHIFSWLFGVATLYFLVEGGRKLLFLPLLTALWANFHGGFILGLALQGIFIAGPVLDTVFEKKKIEWRAIWNTRKLPLIVLLASVLASGINPFGYHLLIFPFLVTKKIFSTGIGEWLPPNMQDEWLFRFYLLGVLLLVSIRGRETGWTNRLLLIFFLNAALSHQRNISLATIFLTPFLAASLAPLAEKFPFRALPDQKGKTLRLSGISGPLATTVLFLLIMVANSPLMPSGRRLFQALITVSPKNHPVNAVRFLNAHPLQGNMFNNYSWGGYLIYALDPPQKVFIDGRADMYGEKIFGDYREIVGIEKGIEELLEQYQVNWILFPEDAPLVRYLMATGNWREIYRDEEASVLLRNPNPRP